MKKYCLGILVLCLLLTGCASEEDKTAAQQVISQIENLDTISLDSADDIYNVQMAYNDLTNKQKKLVTNVENLNNAVSTLEELIEEQQMQQDPTYHLKESEMVGIWREDVADSHRGYFYFTSKGYVYYVASKGTVNKDSFTSEYILGTSYSLDTYNKSTHTKDGKFYNTVYGKDSTYSVTKDEKGTMRMDMSCGSASGTYTKTGEKIDTSPKQCLHTGCTNKAVTTGDSVYCEKHSAKCLECGKYIDEDAMFCLNCLVEALRQSQ